MVNHVILIGTLESQPILNDSNQGVPYTRFKLKTVRTWEKDGEQKKHINMHSILAYGKTAELTCKYFTAEKPIYLEGHINRRTHNGHDIDEVVATRMTFVDDPNFKPKRAIKKNYDTDNFNPDDIPF